MENNKTPLQENTENENVSESVFDEKEEKQLPKAVVKTFLTKWSGLIIVLSAVCIVIVMGILALVLGGKIYDKVSMLWIIAFLAEYVVRKFVTGKKLLCPSLFIYAGLSVAFALLYALSLVGILP